MRKLQALGAVLALAFPAAALAASDILMHRDPGCGCCAKWAEQLQAQLGRTVRIVDDSERPAFQQRVGIPAGLSSCHTAVIDGYAFEGHVPIADMKRLLAARPKEVKGLAVAGMPIGSPGMEVIGMQAQPFQVIAFGSGRHTVFSRHGDAHPEH